MYDVAKVFPFLAGLEKTTIRLHPRRCGDLPINASKIGGKFLWPKNEPWPVCSLPEVALLSDYDWSDSKDNIWSVGHPKHNDAYVGVLQLRAKDFPEMEFPVDKNLFQLLWCPRDHEFKDGWRPDWRIFWRREGDIINLQSDIPEPNFVHDDYMPNPCSLNPELVIEYPIADTFSADVLSGEEIKIIRSWEKRERLEEYFYNLFLSVAPGTKIGGYANWIQAPEIPVCNCGQEMNHLLTIDSSEFSVNDYLRWCPLEDQSVWEEVMRDIHSENSLVHEAAAEAQVSSGLCIGDCGSLYFFICRKCPEWPIESVFQCS